MTGYNIFKAGSVADRSEDILVSFSSKWRDAIYNKEIKFVFRRRCPASFVPRRVYIYLASPHSEVVGFFTLMNLRRVSLSEAKTLEHDAHLTARELQDYFEGYDAVGCYAIKDTVLLLVPIRLTEIRQALRFYPPQSFVVASIVASDWLEKMSARELHSCMQET